MIEIGKRTGSLSLSFEQLTLQVIDKTGNGQRDWPTGNSWPTTWTCNREPTSMFFANFNVISQNNHHHHHYHEMINMRVPHACLITKSKQFNWMLVKKNFFFFFLFLFCSNFSFLFFWLIWFDSIANSVTFPCQLTGCSVQFVCLFLKWKIDFFLLLLLLFDLVFLKKTQKLIYWTCFFMNMFWHIWTFSLFFFSLFSGDFKNIWKAWPAH